jgi:hypothetical protein
MRDGGDRTSRWLANPGNARRTEMKNLAHVVANDTMGTTDTLLPLSAGGAVKQVYIQVVSGVVGMASQETGPFSFDGLTWQLDPEYGLFINFNFVKPSNGEQIKELTYKTPLFWLSAVSNNTQGCCVPSIAGTYKFFVHTESGLRFDPKIVVTPL